MSWEWDYENEQWTKLPPYLKHLPLFTRHYDLTSKFFRLLWALFLKLLAYRFYVRIKLHGEFHTIAKNYPKLIVISNHASHLDATSMAAVIPFRYWPDLYVTAAKDYFFGNPIFDFFSKHCLGAIPIDRKDKKGEAVKLILTLLRQLDRIWMIFFPEGTRSKDGAIQEFRRGISLFSQETSTPILFLYIKGNSTLWPKGQLIPSPGVLDIYVGPVCPPGAADVIHDKYVKWVLEMDPEADIHQPNE